MENNGFKQSQRWYDKDPTLSLAVSFIRNASHEQQTEIAERIIKKTTEMGIVIDEIKILFHRRWFDENEELSIAMEHLRLASEEDKRIIALDVINFLTEIKT